MTTLKEEIKRFWDNLSSGQFKSAVYLDVDEYLSQRQIALKEEAIKLFPLCIDLLHHGIQACVNFQNINIHRIQSNARKPVSNLGFWMLQGRQVSLACSFRLLILSGFEDASRLIARSLIETDELALACLVNENLSKAYTAEDPAYNEKAFWKGNVAYGKINEHYMRVLERIGLEKEDIDSIIEYRKELKEVLSSSVHSAVSSAFRSMLVPSLSKTGYLYPGFTGHHSAHAPSTCVGVIEELYDFLEIVIKLLISNDPPSTLAEIELSELDSFFASTVTFQEFFFRYHDNLRPDKE
jgi:hypothetical protein